MYSSNYNQPAKTKQYIEHIFQTSFEGNLNLITFDVVSIDFPVIHDYFSGQDDINYIVRLFQQGEILPAYAPFLEAIKLFFLGAKRDELIALFTEIGVYTLQIPLFVDYVMGSVIKREPEVLREEIYYEKRRLIEGIVALLSYMSLKQDTVIFLDHLHFAPIGTLEIIEALVDTKQPLNILLLLAFDSNYFGDNDENILFSKIVQEFESKDQIIRLETSYFNEDNYVYSKPHDEEYSIQVMDECLNFLALVDCIKVGNILYTAMNSESRYGHQEQYYHILKTVAQAYYYQRDKDSAMFYDNMALSIAVNLKDEVEECDTKIRLGYDHAIRADYSTARKYAADASEIAKRIKNNYMIYRCHFLNFMIDKDSLHIDRRVSEKNLNMLIEETQKRGYDNYLSLLYTNPYELHDHFTREKEDRLEMGLAIIEKTKNEHQLGNAYHNWGIAYSSNGNMDKAYSLYRKSQVIKEKICDNRRTSFIYNSLGYYYMEMEQYSLAHAEYVKSLKTSLMSKDYHEMCMTLYNLMLNAFMYEAYTFVCDCAVKLIKLLSVSKIQTIKYHSKKMIYNLYIIALYKCQEIARAKDTYNKVLLWGIREIENKNEELFISSMVEFYLADQLIDKENALNKAESYIPYTDKSLVHFRNYYFLEKIIFYKERQQNYYKKVLKLFKSEINTKDEPYTMDRLEALAPSGFMKKSASVPIAETNQNHSMELGSIDIDFERIIFTANMDNSVLKLHHRINQINFLNLVQTMLFNEENKNQLVLSLQQLIHGNTKVEKTYCRQITNASYMKLNIENSVYVINEVYAERVFGYIKDKTQAAILHFGNTSTIALKKVYGYSSLMYLPIYSDKERVIELLLMTQRNDEKFNQDDLNLYNLIARQAGEAMSRINKNEKLQSMNKVLEYISTTDSITGLANRNALEIQLQKEQAELLEKYCVIGCMFIDLDNFKYYNDTFGHDIGDQLLKKFGEILKDNVRNTDFVARFGGDEFVVLLRRDTSLEIKQDIKELSDSIYTSLEEAGYFEQLISDRLNKPIYITESSRISCSIGVAESYDTKEKNVYAILKSSDLALYEAKKKGKGKLIFHEER